MAFTEAGWMKYEWAKAAWMTVTPALRKYSSRALTG